MRVLGRVGVLRRVGVLSYLGEQESRVAVSQIQSTSASEGLQKHSERQAVVEPGASQFRPQWVPHHHCGQAGSNQHLALHPEGRGSWGRVLSPRQVGRGCRHLPTSSVPILGPCRPPTILGRLEVTDVPPTPRVHSMGSHLTFEGLLGGSVGSTSTL